MLDLPLRSLSLVSRMANRALGGRWPETLCYRSLTRDAPLWCVVMGASAEWLHPGHLAWASGG